MGKILKIKSYERMVNLLDKDMVGKVCVSMQTFNFLICRCTELSS